MEMMVTAEPPSGVWPGSGVIDLPFVFRPLTQNREQCGATQWDCCPQGTFSQVVMRFSLLLHHGSSHRQKPFFHIYFIYI